MARNARRQFARRLRELREFELGEKLTQDMVAEAFSQRRSLTGAAVSTWESPQNDKRPSDERVLQYALLFCSADNLKPRPHVPDEAQLDKLARQQFFELRRELLRLREEADREARNERESGQPSRRRHNALWRGDRAAEIVVVTSELTEAEVPDVAHADNVNYTRLARYGHLDAFFELYVRLAELGFWNRRHRSAEERGIHTEHNLALVGGPTGNRLTRNFQRLLRMPVQQRIALSGEPEVFVREDGEEIGPVVHDFADGDREVVSDVGLFVRAPNPANPETSITICSGCYTAGVLGSVRVFTHPDTVQANADVITSRLGQTDSFYALFTVPVINGRVGTPRLANTLLECGALT